jgi:hypothetical protein
VTRKLSLSSPHFLDVLVDPEHGLFLWSPLLALAAAGLVYEVWRRRGKSSRGRCSWRCCCKCGSTAPVLSWHQAGAFGSRRFVASSAMFAFGLAALLEAFSARRALLAASLLVLRVVERLVDGPVRPEADGPPASRVAEGRDKPIHRGAAPAGTDRAAVLQRSRALAQETR